MDFLPNQLLKSIKSGCSFVLGVDGLGGAGKTTFVQNLAEQLQQVDFKPVILHIDDYIHPKHVRYDSSKEEWYCYYHLQWRYDYLIREILAPITDDQEIHKQIELYDKENDNYVLEQIDIPKNSILLLEGVFLQRPELRLYLNCVIFIDVPQKERLLRVMKRDTYIGNPEAIKAKCERRYFPAEEIYMAECDPITRADFLVRYQ